MGCLAIFFLSEALHEVELSSTFRNGLQELTPPLHSVSPLQQLFSQFHGSFNKGTCAHFLFFVPRSIARQVAEKIAQCNGASTSTSATCNAKFSTIARQAAEKISQCNGALNQHCNRFISHVENRVKEARTLS